MTKFFDWHTMYGRVRSMMRADGDRKGASFDQFEDLLHSQARIVTDPRSARILDELKVITAMERVWLEAGSPYYNVHPEMVEKLCRSDLSKIPAAMFKMPHEYKAVNIRLPPFVKILTYPRHMAEHLASQYSFELTDAQPVSVSTLLAWHQPDHGRLLLSFGAARGDAEIVYAEGLAMGLNMPLPPVTCILRTNGTDSLADEIDRFYLQCDQGISGLNKEFYSNLLRLVVTIGFLSDNPTICEADVLNKDRYNFDREQDPEKREGYAARARRKGKVGYNVGTDLMFLDHRPRVKQSGTGEPTGRELEYAHIRGGHPHAVRYGPNREKVKIRWYVPITVRADLPFKVETANAT